MPDCRVALSPSAARIRAARRTPARPFAVAPQEVLFVDLDSDGDMDALSACWYDDKIAWCPNQIYSCAPGVTGFGCDRCTFPHAGGDLCDVCDEGWGGAYCQACVTEEGCD